MEKSSNYAEDADVSKLCGSAPTHPARCPEISQANKTTELCFFLVYFYSLLWFPACSLVFFTFSIENSGVYFQGNRSV